MVPQAIILQALSKYVRYYYFFTYSWYLFLIFKCRLINISRYVLYMLVCKPSLFLILFTLLMRRGITCT